MSKRDTDMAKLENALVKANAENGSLQQKCDDMIRERDAAVSLRKLATNEALEAVALLRDANAKADLFCFACGKRRMTEDSACFRGCKLAAFLKRHPG